MKKVLLFSLIFAVFIITAYLVKSDVLHINLLPHQHMLIFKQ